MFTTSAMRQGSRLFWCAVKHAGDSVPLLQQDGAGADESRDAE
jgi:hypothetical protein